MTDLTVLTGLIDRADAELVRTVDALAGAAYAEPSLLPGWTRAHVVAHLTLNAEALAGVLHGAHVGEPQPMYASVEGRDADIAGLADASPSALRERFLASTTLFGEALGAMGEDDWAGRFDRVPDGPTFQHADIPLMRLRELEIHHADLSAGYTPADWSDEFATVLLDAMTRFRTSTPFGIRAIDLDRSWHFGEGEGGPVVSGTAGALGWWLTGRGTGDDLTSDTNELPEMEAW
ncbi:maleylpyruvate isomerase family mycothiol-dependent enzyme [Nocardioides hwasunensis]|uniref:Maleylpyruvate isomerase family mycothiol-dependent enzyme n=1 Tax=Nocardioides hwasunensis TaxID=397258 RepID=A0ABR8MBV7_9ACTN|nr:maleylpyruvate isomerase family mycothiol-dependent enzyme [Nocardioides hwasunensis]MBD3913631.1 maleylpyruvate isomerase family mycothiol-dependent enzyme [Nocardioides hwasunensis]